VRLTAESISPNCLTPGGGALGPRVANYDAVSVDVTGHAQSVQVTFNPRVIS
jgi:peptide methionine sulfoxide reductase MsrA